MQHYYAEGTNEWSGSMEVFMHIGVSLPPNTTLIEPLPPKSGFAVVWNGSEWNHVEDHRGKTIYRIEDKLLCTFTILGPIPAGYTMAEPGAITDKWDGTKWVADQSAIDRLTEEGNVKLKAKLTSEANHQIATLTDATDPDIMGDDIVPEDVELLKQWKAYRVKLNRIVDMLNPVWPAKPE